MSQVATGQSGPVCTFFTITLHKSEVTTAGRLGPLNNSGRYTLNNGIQRH
ncbi:hypothetical protein SACS_0377 [Parasaccharibacter apium]|uniref:Uncharacterized protein n=1 Tax=Parasaccharibacter apium TaxID=1510841 RepID=A0A7U7G4R8_9PROT|nr:hypothetical protein SACS_0377 [Parasaccharibacter apium]